MRCPKSKNIKAVFYVVVDGKQAGPLNKSELARLVKNGIVTAETLVWIPGIAQWIPAQYIPDVNKLLLLYGPEKKFSAADKKESTVREDLISAISVLGYRMSAIRPAVEKVLEINPDIGLEEGIKKVLLLIH